MPLPAKEKKEFSEITKNYLALWSLLKEYFLTVNLP